MKRCLIFIVIVLLSLVPVEAAGVLETFENVTTAWVVSRDTVGSGTITRSSTQKAAGSFSAALQTASASSGASIRVNFSDPVSAHIWEELTGTWHWQRASVYLPSSTVSQLNTSGETLTLAGIWASSDPNQFHWYLKIGQNADMSVAGVDANGVQAEFRVYGTFPLDQWVELEIGLHTQAGPGVKRAFSFLVNGQYYGWFRQGRMTSETYDRMAMGILTTNSPNNLTVYVDEWRVATSASFPDGPDTRSTAALQEKDYRTQNGAIVQHDWGTWANTPALDPTFGLYVPTLRIQSGRNIERMPDVSNGWGEIEIDWPNGIPPQCINSYCSAMIGFRKNVNREENLEVIPVTDVSGQFFLIFEAWVNDGPVVAPLSWRIPDAAAASGRNMPEPGDIIRARWEQVSTTNLNVRASYYDASAQTWYDNIIDYTFNATNYHRLNPPNQTVNYLDGYHTASSITIDSPYYSIRRYKLGTLATYPEPDPPDAAPVRNYYTTGSPTLTWNRVTGATGYIIEVAKDTAFTQKVFTPPQQSATTYSITINPALTTEGVYYWHVRAVNSTGGLSPWSATDSFTIKL